MDRFQYLIVMALCVLVTLPLEFVFGPGCGGVRGAWRGAGAGDAAVRRLGPVGAPSGTWGFDRRYTVGLRLPGGMAVEELVFFTVVPICALLTLEAVRNLLSGRVTLHRPVGTG